MAMDKEEEKLWRQAVGEGGLDFVKFSNQLEEDGYTIGEDEERGTDDILLDEEEREDFILNRLLDLTQIQETHPELILSLFRAFMQNHNLPLLAVTWGLLQLKHRPEYKSEP